MKAHENQNSKGKKELPVKQEIGNLAFLK